MHSLTTFKNFLNEDSTISGRIKQIALQLLSVKSVKKITGTERDRLVDLMTARQSKDISMQRLKVPLGEWEIGLFNIDGTMIVRAMPSYDDDAVFYAAAR